MYKKAGSRAVGSKDVILFPKSCSSKAASEELKQDRQVVLKQQEITPQNTESIHQEVLQERNVVPRVEETKEKVILPDEDVAMIEQKENSEQHIVNEADQPDDHQEKQDTQSKSKHKKKNKKNKNKGKN